MAVVWRASYAVKDTRIEEAQKKKKKEDGERGTLPPPTYFQPLCTIRISMKTDIQLATKHVLQLLKPNIRLI